MSSTHSDSRIRLGQILDPEIPLGPFEDLFLTIYESPTGLGKSHGDPQCRMLRSGRAITSREAQLSLAVGNLCGHCTWPVPNSHPVLDFLDAVTAVAGLKTWIGSACGPEPGGAGHADVQDAADDGLSVVGRPGDQVSAAQLRGLRERQCRQWRRLHTCMLASYAATTAYPGLGGWAQPLQTALAEVIECRRRELATLLEATVLVQAACAAALTESLPVAGPAFAELGTEAPRVLQQAWSRWQGAVGSNWDRLEESRSAATSVVYEAFGRRRKGRTEALQALDVLIADWTAKARTQAARCESDFDQPVTIQLPPNARDALTGTEQDPLTCWDAGVIATHQVAARWPQGDIELLLSQPVAEHLLGSMGPLRALDRPSPLALPPDVEGREEHGQMADGSRPGPPGEPPAGPGNS
jgi:hypothetical protein